MAKVNVKLICFDIGGVLLRVCTSFEEGVKRAGLSLRLNSAAMARRFDAAHIARHQYRTGKIDAVEFSYRVSEAFGGVYSAAEVHSVMKSWVGETYHGIEPMFAALRANGHLKVAVLSNTCSDHWKHIIARPWMKHVDYTFPSHELGTAKPAPETFAAVERATKIPAKQILFFDDASENVAVSARRGWNSVLITHDRDRSAQIRAALPEGTTLIWPNP